MDPTPATELLPHDLVDLGPRCGVAPGYGDDPPLDAPADAPALDACYRALIPGHAIRAVTTGLDPARAGRHATLCPLAADAEPDAVSAALAAGHVGIVITDPDPVLIADDLAAAAAAAGTCVLLAPRPPSDLARDADRLVLLCEDHPDADFVLPRCGGCLSAEQLRPVFSLLPKRADNCHLGLDLIQDWELLRILLRSWDRDRLVWGSGLPLAAEPGRLVAVGDAVHPVTVAPYPWSLHYPPGGPILAADPMLHAALAAFATAAAKVGLRPVEAHAIFAGNALRLIDTA